MSDKAAAGGGVIARHWQRPGRAAARSPHRIGMLRRRLRNGSTVPAADRCEESSRTGELETWPDSTIFASMIGAAATGLGMWTALGCAVWQTFVHWT